MDRIPQPPADWSGLIGYINNLIDKVNEIDCVISMLAERIPKKKTPEEIKAMRIENLKKARAARGK